MNEKGMMAAVEGLSKGYGEGESRIEVLRKLSLEVVQGEMVAVVGPSGVGKSTLLHLVGLLDRPEDGRILLAGEDVGVLNPQSRARLRNHLLGFVFQHHHLLDELDALENVALPMRIAGHHAAPARKRAEELLDRVGLKERMDHFPDQLSGGEQQRVAIARALVMGPRLLLADEPTGNLDRRSSEKVFELIRELHRDQGLTSMIVTHNEEIARRCDRTIILRNEGSNGSDG